MYKNILIATDGSKFANAAVAHGVQLAQCVHASVVLVTVTQSWSAFQMAENMERGAASPVSDYEASMKKQAEKVLAEAQAVAISAGVNSKTVHVSDSYPAEGIIETADRENCDLIVMASHGRRGLSRMLLGSQTAEVLGFSKQPVLVLRR